MSKRTDPKDVAIAFVMTAPIDVAVAFVQTLGAVVKARAQMAPGTAPARESRGKAVSPATPGDPSTPRARPRAVPGRPPVQITDPNETPETAETSQPALPS